jgi:hypothetical protein
MKRGGTIGKDSAGNDNQNSQWSWVSVCAKDAEHSRRQKLRHPFNVFKKSRIYVHHFTLIENEHRTELAGAIQPFEWYNSIECLRISTCCPML